ncbi:hypothetical protein [Scytonema sp. NUACC26]|uniref:hypothetical protein n=1 Tax=Scytonema sp. NUACC26 TaxID=3140176 RepID=UPI0034DC4491
MARVAVPPRSKDTRLPRSQGVLGEEKLDRWKREIESLERKAQAHCNRLKL